MTTLLWVLTLYALTITLTYKPILWYLKGHPEVAGPFTPEFVAGIIAFIPIYNIWEAAKVWKYRYVLKKRSKNFPSVADMLEERFKDHPDPELREQVKGIAEGLRGLKDDIDQELKQEEK